MKKQTLTIVVFFSLSIAFADEARYKEAMQKNIAALYSAQTPAEFQNAINIFERIASAEKTKWEPYYYSSFGYVELALREKDPAKKDGYLDLANADADKAAAMKANDSEIIALQGFVTMIRITVDPSVRGQQLSGTAMQSFKKALAISPENPRAIALNAQMEFGMARFFGSTSATACNSAQKALDILAKEKATNDLAPTWGKLMAEDLLKQCK